MQIRSKINLKPYLKKVVYIIGGILLLLLLIISWVYFTLPDVSDLIKKNPSTTALIDYRKNQAAENNRSYKVRQQWVSFNSIPDLLKKSVRISEDAGFYFHEGIDYTELWESVKRNWEEGRFARGGSTISQQLAKNLYLSPKKSLFRKFREALISQRLEDTLNKNRIFHLYLNVIEFGPGIFGVQAASQYYFGKDVNALNLEEIIRLTAVIPKPLLESPKKNSRWLLWKSRWILGKLKKYKYISVEQHDQVIEAFK